MVVVILPIHQGRCDKGVDCDFHHRIPDQVRIESGGDGASAGTALVVLVVVGIGIGILWRQYRNDERESDSHRDCDSQGGSSPVLCTPLTDSLNQEDERRLGAARDIFGRERFADDRADMGGVGSFSRESLRPCYLLTCCDERGGRSDACDAWNAGL